MSEKPESGNGGAKGAGAGAEGEAGAGASAGKKGPRPPMKLKLPKGRNVVAAAGLLGGAGALVYGIANSLYNVDGGHRAVVFNRVVGVKDKVYNEGTHFRLPWFDMPTIYDIRTKPRNIASWTGSRDLQMVNISLRVLSRPNVDNLPTIHKNIGQDYDEKVLPSIVNEVLKSVVAQFNASQLITQREQVSQLIRRRLTERATDFDIVIEDVSLTDLRFGKEYMKAVEDKQVAQQEAERAKYIVLQAEQDKRSTIVRADGEAKSAELIGAAMKDNPAFLDLRRIEAARAISGTLSRSQNKVYLNADSLLMTKLGDSKPADKVEMDAGDLPEVTPISELPDPSELAEKLLETVQDTTPGTAETATPSPF